MQAEVSQCLELSDIPYLSINCEARQNDRSQLRTGAGICRAPVRYCKCLFQRLLGADNDKVPQLLQKGLWSR